MKKLLPMFAFAAALSFAVTFTMTPARAAAPPTSLVQTTLSAAMTATQTTARLASATGTAVGGWLYIDHEAMQVTAISSTTMTVNRSGTGNSNINTHASAANVFVATAAIAAQTFLPHETAVRAGNCTPSNYQYLPIIDVETGDVYFCEYEAAAAAYRVWRVINIQGYNGAGSYRTSWVWP